jgi:hypothetical protein
VLRDEPDRQPLAGRDVDVVLVRRDLGRVEVDRVRHVDGHLLGEPLTNVICTRSPCVTTIGGLAAVPR